MDCHIGVKVRRVNLPGAHSLIGRDHEFVRYAHALSDDARGINGRLPMGRMLGSGRPSLFN